MGAPPPERRGSPLRLRWAVLRFHCAPGPSQDPLTRAHVRLLGPCFKTGRVGDRPTRCQPRASDGSVAANGVPQPSAHSLVVRRREYGALATTSPATTGWRRRVPEGTRDPSVWRRATDGTANNRQPARGEPPATCHFPTFRPPRLHFQTGCSVLRTRDKCVWNYGRPAAGRPQSREALPELSHRGSAEPD